MASWLSKVKGMDFYPIYGVTRSDVGTKRVIGDVYSFIRPSTLMEKKDPYGIRADIGLGAANMMMGAYCDTYADFGFNKGTPLKAQFTFGTLAFELEGKNADAQSIIEEIGVLFYPKENIVQEVKRFKDKKEWTNHYEAYTNGFYAEDLNILVIGVQEDTDAMKKVLVHESIHALVAQVPELKRQMYGQNEVIQMEEIVTHAVTDFFEQLMSIHSLDFNVQPHVVETVVESESGKVKNTLTIPLLAGVKHPTKGELFSEDTEITGAELDKLAKADDGKTQRYEFW